MLSKRGGSEKGKLANAWKGGRFQQGKGYWMIYMPEHPRAYKGYILEHIVLMEIKIGRSLRKGEEIHHMGRRDDNTRIKLCKNRVHHFLLHMRLKAVRAGVLPSWRKCKFCKKWDKPENLFINNSTWACYNRKCSNQTRRLYRIEGGKIE
jgi:hypothetical protein